MKKKNIVDEDSNQKLLGYLPAHSTTIQRNTSLWTHVIVSYLKVICNLQAGSRDKQVF